MVCWKNLCKACEGVEVCDSGGKTFNVLEPAREKLREGQVWRLLAHYLREMLQVATA